MSGDAVLMHVAQLCQETLRTKDSLFRLGGEEFGVILGNTDIDAATEVIERAAPESCRGHDDGPGQNRFRHSQRRYFGVRVLPTGQSMKLCGAPMSRSIKPRISGGIP